MKEIDFEHAFQLKKLELEALLEVTQAINDNMPEAQLYRIFYFTLRANLNIDKFALYVYEEDKWVCKVVHSSSQDFKAFPLDNSLMESIDESADTDALPPEYRKEFQQFFPIRHKEQTLAYMFLNSGSPALPGGDSDLKFVRALTNIIIVAIENKKLARKELEQKAMQRELEIAKDVQQFLFPERLPHTPHLQVEARYLPHHQVGGDYYDYIEIDTDKFLLCVADVSGKGVPAAILMANFQASLRTMVRQTVDLKEIVHELNHQVMQSAHGENFITAFFGLFNKKEQVLQFVNSGHNPPFLIRKERKDILPLEKGSTILGALKNLPFLNVGKVENLHHFQLFCFTDGLTETFNNHDEAWGPERLEAFLKQNHDLELKELHDALMKEIDDFRQDEPFNDDITMLSCFYKAS